MELKPSSPASALHVDSAGRIYWRDDNLFIHRVDEITGAGHVQFGGVASHLFNGPSGIATDSLGRIYVSDSISNKVTRFDDMTGANPVVLGGTGSGINQFDLGGLAGNTTGRQIAIDSQNRLYVADFANHRIVRVDDITGAGWTTFTIPDPHGTGPKPFSVDVSKSSSFRIVFTTLGGEPVYSMTDMSGAGLTSYGTPNGTGPDAFKYPVAVAIKP